MYNHNITMQEQADYIADMLEMSAQPEFPTDEEMDDMERYWVETISGRTFDFDTEAEAENFCIMNGIHFENIYHY
jgi:hypothetical protein